MKYWVRLEKLKITREKKNRTRFSGTIIGCSENFYKILGIAIIYILCKKNKKYTEKVQWKCAKTAYFRHFRPEKNVFRKSDSVTFWILPFRIIVQNFMKKYEVQLKKFKKYCFFRRKSAVPAIFREFQLQKSVLLTNEPCSMVGIVINNIIVRKNNEI